MSTLILRVDQTFVFCFSSRGFEHGSVWSGLHGQGLGGFAFVGRYTPLNDSCVVRFVAFLACVFRLWFGWCVVLRMLYPLRSVYMFP